MKELEEKLNILLAEDNLKWRQNGELAEEILKDKGYNVKIISVPCLLEAKKELESSRHNMLITDIEFDMDYSETGKDLQQLLTPIKEDFAADIKQIRKDNKKFIDRKIKELYEAANELQKEPISKEFDRDPRECSFFFTKEQKKGNWYYDGKYLKEYYMDFNNRRFIYRHLSSVPLVYFAKKLEMPYGILTGFHYPAGLKEYHAFDLVNGKEIVLAYMMGGRNEKRDKIVDYAVSQGSRLFSYSDKDSWAGAAFKPPRIWAKVIESVIENTKKKAKNLVWE
ncbi:hypothetical protein KY348_02285 [Candidatus Woesearchaeota archaeon]|nr:hypothetical protein [Candidatus Woesearchaeota archaeon]